MHTLLQNSSEEYLPRLSAQMFDRNFVTECVFSNLQSFFDQFAIRSREKCTGMWCNDLMEIITKTEG